MDMTHPGGTDGRARALLPALGFFLVMTSYYIVRPVRDQLSGAVGSSWLPLFYGAVFLVMLLITPVFGMLVARWPRRQLLLGSYGFFIVCLVLFVPAFMAQERIGERTLGVVFFVWVSVFNLFVVSLFWSFMADIFDSGEARRVFPLIALGGMAGAIFGPVLAKLLVDSIGVAPLLLVSALALAAAMAVVWQLAVDDERAAGGIGGQPTGGSLWAGVRELWSSPFLRNMALLMLLGDGIGTLAYALVADYAKAHFDSAIARTAFYNDLDLATNLLGAALQLTLTRWLLVRHGAGWGLVLPAVLNVAVLAGMTLLAGGAVPWLGGSVPVVALMLVVTRGMAYGMGKPAADALYTRVVREARYKGKNFVETAVWRFGDLVVTSAVSGLRAVGVGLAGLGLLGTVVAAAATVVARRAGWAPDLSPEHQACVDRRAERS